LTPIVRGKTTDKAKVKSKRSKAKRSKATTETEQKKNGHRTERAIARCSIVRFAVLVPFSFRSFSVVCF
jgi:hypothetical protein